MEKISITDEHINLGQFLKLTNLFDSGGFIKNYLQNEGVFVNNVKEHRRGRKLYNDDVVQIDESNIFILHAEK
ncbi:MAG TPA: RNA-binding S4 domain-containing protein [Pseudogracilibacillus sp.]|nr:RNA-binding S4 domain-containing protein [Pseudogracilibacillus sp.]